MAANFDIFISHAQRDAPSGWARQLKRALQDHGLSVWLDEDQIRPGKEWGNEILEGLERSSNIVFLVGPGANQSNAVGLELGMALASGKRIIPVVDVDPPREEIPGPLRLRQYLKKGDPQVVAGEIAEALTVRQPG